MLSVLKYIVEPQHLSSPNSAQIEGLLFILFFVDLFIFSSRRVLPLISDIQEFLAFVGSIISRVFKVSPLFSQNLEGAFFDEVNMRGFQVLMVNKLIDAVSFLRKRLN